jgi:hypothetical protein
MFTLMQNYDAARANFAQAQTLGPWLFEPLYNGGENLSCYLFVGRSTRCYVSELYHATAQSSATLYADKLSWRTH